MSDASSESRGEPAATGATSEDRVVTSSSEARVPHDPRYLRAAAKVVNDSRTTVRTADGGALADRLEAWADDLEREATHTARLDSSIPELLRCSASYFRCDSNDADPDAAFLDMLADSFDQPGPLAFSEAEGRMVPTERLAPLDDRVAAVLDALNVEDLRRAVLWLRAIPVGGQPHLVADRLDAVADALAALREAQTNG